MINAGFSFTGNITGWDSINLKWKNVEFIVNYPIAGPGENQQTEGANAPSVNDYLIDESMNIWKIIGNIIKTGNNKWTSDIQIQNKQNLEEVEPDLAGTTYGCICTPIKNALNPYYDNNIVKNSVARVAMQFNIQEEKIGGSESPILPEFIKVTTEAYSAEVDNNIFVDTSIVGKEIIITLPPANTFNKKYINIKKIKGAYDVILRPSGLDKIDNVSEVRIKFLDCYTIASDNISNLYIV